MNYWSQHANKFFHIYSSLLLLLLLLIKKKEKKKEYTNINNSNKQSLFADGILLGLFIH